MAITKTISEDYAIVADGFQINGRSIYTSPRAHDTSYSPAAMWQLDGNLNDSIGTNHLSLISGTTLYSYYDTLRGVFFNGSTLLAGTANYTPLLVVGDLTVECLIVFTRIHTTQQRFLHESGTALSDSGPTNNLWTIDTTATNGALQYANEYTDAGTNGLFTSTVVPAVGVLHHLAMTRESDIVKFFLNGNLAATSGILPTPTYSGTPQQRIEMGGATGLPQNFQGFISSVKIIKSALTADQILREANYTLHGGL